MKLLLLSLLVAVSTATTFTAVMGGYDNQTGVFLVFSVFFQLLTTSVLALESMKLGQVPYEGGVKLLSRVGLSPFFLIFFFFFSLLSSPFFLKCRMKLGLSEPRFAVLGQRFLISPKAGVSLDFVVLFVFFFRFFFSFVFALE
jgi:hypothetical protein